MNHTSRDNPMTVPMRTSGNPISSKYTSLKPELAMSIPPIIPVKMENGSSPALFASCKSSRMECDLLARCSFSFGGVVNESARKRPMISITSPTKNGRRISYGVRNGSVMRNTMLMMETLADCWLEILAYSFSLPMLARVSCKNAEDVPDWNAKANDRKTLPMTYSKSDWAKMNESVETIMQSLERINVFLWPNWSEKYPEGISKRKDAMDPIPV